MPIGPVVLVVLVVSRVRSSNPWSRGPPQVRTLGTPEPAGFDPGEKGLLEVGYMIDAASISCSRPERLSRLLDILDCFVFPGTISRFCPLPRVQEGVFNMMANQHTEHVKKRQFQLYNVFVNVFMGFGSIAMGYSASIIGTTLGIFPCSTSNMPVHN